MDLHHLLLAGLPAHSGLPRSADIIRPAQLVRFVAEAEVAGACSRVSFGIFAYAAAAIGQLAETPMASKAASIGA